MTMIWIGGLLAAGATALVTLSSWRRRVHMADLGSVSEGWLAEQRATERHYSER